MSGRVMRTSIGTPERAFITTAHRGQQRAHPQPGAGAAEPEAIQHGLHHVVEIEPAVQVQLGGEPDLRVHDAVRGEVLGALAGDADDRVPPLHHADRVLERLQVQLEPAALGHAHLRRHRGPLEDGGRHVDARDLHVAGEPLAAEADGVHGDGAGAEAGEDVMTEAKISVEATRSCSCPD